MLYVDNSPRKDVAVPMPDAARKGRPTKKDRRSLDKSRDRLLD